MASTRSRLDEIVASFSTLEDPRSHINRRHPLPGVLVIAVLAVLAGAAGPTAIARWAKLKEDLLTGILDLPHGIPGKDVFRRVLMTLKPAAFEAGCNAWIDRLRDQAVAETGVDRPIIAIDGKSARRSHDASHDLGALPFSFFLAVPPPSLLARKLNRAAPVLPCRRRPSPSPLPAPAQRTRPLPSLVAATWLHWPSSSSPHLQQAGLLLHHRASLSRAILLPPQGKQIQTDLLILMCGAC